MKKRWLASLGALLVMVLIVPSMGHAATSSDATTDTIEPILVKSDAQASDPTLKPFFRSATATSPANITSFTMSTDGTNIIADVTTRGNLLRCAPNKPAPVYYDGTQACPQSGVAPYAGAHVLVLFQVPNMNVITDVGCVDIPCAGQSKWTPYNPTDRFYMWMSYGTTESEQHEDSSLGVYDPAGRLQGFPLEPGVGQTFLTLGQHYSNCNDLTAQSGRFTGFTDSSGLGNNGSYSFPSLNTVRIKIPYAYEYRTSPTATNPCAYRHKTILTSGQVIKNAVAFSWMDHEIGNPVTGLLLGWTWYTDSVPALETSTGYKVGTPSGDPNPASYAGPSCPLILASRAVPTAVDNPVPPGINEPPVPPVTFPPLPPNVPVPAPAGGFVIYPGGQANPLYNPNGCMIPNPVGPGFSASNLNTTAL
ncbi:MAG: hypothetical protein ABR548_08175 [Actinomycetota bacterium]|nr:hypothetical protein [Actinomycetota bacterium]